MKTVLLLLIIATAACAQETIINNGTDMAPRQNISNLQQAIAGNLNLKMLMVEDGTPRGKCYCSCSLNNQPVFMEIDPSTLAENEMMML